MTEPKEPRWARNLFSQLVDGGVTLFTHVPDAGNAALIRLAERHNETTAVLLSTEEEGVGICAGADLVGAHGVVCMQSSGVGNCINHLSLVKGGRFPIFLIVTMRGDYGEQNPWQYPMGQAVDAVLEAMGLLIFRVDSEADLETATGAALSACFKGGQGVALVLSQRFLGAKAF
ncbi:MAG: phosphonopyruvate decarboxylase [Rhodospirillales bacterium]|nr:MAG: phosphonopyruvate decarboxylase [Rhodospirillales bacterium]